MNAPLPEDWRITTVGQACSIRNDLRFPIAKEVRAGMMGEYPYYGPTGRLDRLSTYRLEGTFALIGEDGDHFMDVENKPQTLLVSGKFNVNNHAHVIASTDVCDVEWFFNYFKHRSLKSSLTRQGAGRYKLNKAALERLPILLPPRPEQLAINRLVREWDSAIEKAERLIAAVQRRHQALRRRLLLRTGSPERRISDLAAPLRRKNLDGNGHPLTISGQDGLISQSKFFDKRIAAEATEHYTLLKRGEFAYNRSYSAGYPFGAIKRLEGYEDGIVSSLYLCFALRPDSPVLSDYLTYYCEAGGFNRQLHQIAQEGARNHGLLNVPPGDFFNMKMPVQGLTEQRRAINLLDDSVLELAKLQKSLGAMRHQKRGLMQKLLTGQWRLPLPESEAA